MHVKDGCKVIFSHENNINDDTARKKRHNIFLTNPIGARQSWIQIPFFRMKTAATLMLLDKKTGIASLINPTEARKRLIQSNFLHMEIASFFSKT